MIDLHGQLKQADWNVRGPIFIAVHELFDKVAEDAASYSDLLERTASVGVVAVRHGPGRDRALHPVPICFAVAATLAAEKGRVGICSSQVAHAGKLNGRLLTKLVMCSDGHPRRISTLR